MSHSTQEEMLDDVIQRGADENAHTSQVGGLGVRGEFGYTCDATLSVLRFRR
jgi:hypothetical protein